MRSTKYIIGFAAVVCLVCSVVVSGSAVSLKERQTINKQLDRHREKRISQNDHRTFADLFRASERQHRAEQVDINTTSPI